MPVEARLPEAGPGGIVAVGNQVAAFADIREAASAADSLAAVADSRVGVEDNLVAEACLDTARSEPCLAASAVGSLAAEGDIRVAEASVAAFVVASVVPSAASVEVVPGVVAEQGVAPVEAEDPDRRNFAQANRRACFWRHSASICHPVFLLPALPAPLTFRRSVSILQV